MFISWHSSHTLLLSYSSAGSSLIMLIPPYDLKYDSVESVFELVRTIQANKNALSLLKWWLINTHNYLYSINCIVLFLRVMMWCDSKWVFVFYCPVKNEIFRSMLINTYKAMQKSPPGSSRRCYSAFSPLEWAILLPSFSLETPLLKAFWASSVVFLLFLKRYSVTRVFCLLFCSFFQNWMPLEVVVPPPYIRFIKKKNLFEQF